jgi:AraC-like DNA-binding protein/mannose-6-phosphate isomerase-like protein (cupin superfamily)
MAKQMMKHSEHRIFKPGKLPTLIYAGHISNEPDWKFPSHKHDDLSEIIYISEGEGTFIINDQKHLAKKGDILIYNRGVIHEEFSNPANPLKTYFCGVGNLFIEGIEEGHMIPSDISPIISSGKYAYKIESYITDIFEESYSQVLGYDIICQNLLTSLISMIIRIIKSESSIYHSDAQDSLVYKLKQYIDKNYTKNITLNDMADQLYISQYYLSHIFKKETSYSPINYLINCRIGEAKRLLFSTDMKVHDIAKYVGYENANYFTMLFKKITGESPKQFRQKYKGQLNKL